MSAADKISQEDMTQIAAAKVKVQLATTLAEKNIAEAKCADLEYRSLVQHIFIRYGLKVTDRIDDNTGEIKREEVTEEPKSEVSNES